MDESQTTTAISKYRLDKRRAKTEKSTFPRDCLIIVNTTQFASLLK